MSEQSWNKPNNKSAYKWLYIGWKPMWANNYSFSNVLALKSPQGISRGENNPRSKLLQEKRPPPKQTWRRQTTLTTTTTFFHLIWSWKDLDKSDHFQWNTFHRHLANREQMLGWVRDRARISTKIGRISSNFRMNKIVCDLIRKSVPESIKNWSRSHREHQNWSKIVQDISKLVKNCLNFISHNSLRCC